MGLNAELMQALGAHLVPASRLEERRQTLGTGVAGLDQLLGGGWPRGALSELRGCRSSGKTSICVRSLAAAVAAAEAVALIDADGALDARRAADAGLDLCRLLWVRGERDGRALQRRSPAGAYDLDAHPAPSGGARQSPPTATQLALKAADLIVDAGGFGLVVVDLGERPARVPDVAWLRLRHAAERQRTAVVVVVPRPLVGAAASVAVTMRSRGPRLGGTEDKRHTPPPLLLALETEAIIERQTGPHARRDAETPHRLTLDAR